MEARNRSCLPGKLGRNTHRVGDPATTVRQAARRDPLTTDSLMTLVYEELRKLAAQYLRHQRPGHTFGATSLVHEAYIRLMEHQKPGWTGQIHFFATAAQAMRRILVDHARRQGALKRGGSRLRVTLAALPAEEQGQGVGELMEMLEKLSELNPRHYEVVTLRFFSGLKVKEVARVLGLSTRSVEEDWRLARAWLWSELKKER